MTIPKHHAKLPVYAHNKAWQRTGDSLVEMRSDRLQAILSEIEVTDDWSAVIVEDATIDDWMQRQSRKPERSLLSEIL